MAILGNNILITKDGTVIGSTRSNEIQSEAELIQISSPTTGEFKEYITGLKSWSVNVSYLIGTNGRLTDLLTVGNSYTLVLKPRGSSAIAVSGTAILKTCKITATKGNLCQGSFQFVGTGPLT